MNFHYKTRKLLTTIRTLTKTTHQYTMNKFILALVAALAAFASAEVIEIKCHAPEMIFKEPIYSQVKKPVIDLEALQQEIDARNAEIAASKPEAQILDFEEIKAKYGDKLVEKLEKIKAKKQVKIIKN